MRTRRPRAAAALAIPALVLGGLLPAAQAAAAPAAPGGTVRAYQPTGTPVQGSDSCQNAPLLQPGSYLDTLRNDKNLYYKVKKRHDQLLQVSATAVVTGGFRRSSNLTVSAGPVVRNSVPEGWLRGYTVSQGWADVISAGGRSTAPAPDKNPPSPVPGDEGCVMIGNNVFPAPDTREYPVELRIGLADANGARQAQAPAVRTGAAAVGGYSFDSATPIGPGTHRQNLVVGEFPVWRVEVKKGQWLSVKAGVVIPDGMPAASPAALTLALHNPTRTSTTCAPDYSGDIEILDRRSGRVEKTCGPWEIAESERTGVPDTNGYLLPGTYYIQAAIAEASDLAQGRTVPLDLTVTLVGTPRESGNPEFGPGTSGAAPGSAPASAGSTGVAATTPAADAPGTSGTSGAAGKSAASGSTPGASSAPGADPAAAASDDDSSALSRYAVPFGVALAVLLLAGVGIYGLKRR